MGRRENPGQITLGPCVHLVRSQLNVGATMGRASRPRANGAAGQHKTHFGPRFRDAASLMLYFPPGSRSSHNFSRGRGCVRVAAGAHAQWRVHLLKRVYPEIQHPWPEPTPLPPEKVPSVPRQTASSSPYEGASPCKPKASPSPRPALRKSLLNCMQSILSAAQPH